MCTNRGRIITPLKDRFGAQIRTHYPADVATEMAIAEAEALPLVVGGRRVSGSAELAEVVATVSHLARSSPHVNQRSGASVRLTVANRETLVANAARRALRLDEAEVVPRISDLGALGASTTGKLEIETLDEGRDQAVVDDLLSAAVLSVFRARVDAGTVGMLVGAFDEGRVVHTGDDVASSAYVDLLAEFPALADALSVLGDKASPAPAPAPAPFLRLTPATGAGVGRKNATGEPGRTKNALAELNRMLEQRAAGEDPDFAGFVSLFGDLFPENSQSLGAAGGHGQAHGRHGGHGQLTV